MRETSSHSQYVCCSSLSWFSQTPQLFWELSTHWVSLMLLYSNRIKKEGDRNHHRGESLSHLTNPEYSPSQQGNQGCSSLKQQPCPVHSQEQKEMHACMLTLHIHSLACWLVLTLTSQLLHSSGSPAWGTLLPAVGCVFSHHWTQPRQAPRDTFLGQPDLENPSRVSSKVVLGSVELPV